MPPTPRVSPMVCRRPWRSGISRSARVASRPPTMTVTTTTSAPSRAAARSRWDSTTARSPRSARSRSATPTATSRRSASMSCRRQVISISASHVARSVRRSWVNSTLPAPTKAITVVGDMGPSEHPVARVAPQMRSRAAHSARFVSVSPMSTTLPRGARVPSAARATRLAAILDALSSRGERSVERARSRPGRLGVDPAPGPGAAGGPGPADPGARRRRRRAADRARSCRCAIATGGPTTRRRRSLARSPRCCHRVRTSWG